MLCFRLNPVKEQYEQSTQPNKQTLVTIGSTEEVNVSNDFSPTTTNPCRQDKTSYNSKIEF